MTPLRPAAESLVGRSGRSYWRKGSFDLVHSPEEADLLLRVKLFEYIKVSRSLRPDDTLLAAGFDMEVAASLNLYSSRKKSLVMDNHVVRAQASL